MSARGPLLRSSRAARFISGRPHRPLGRRRPRMQPNHRPTEHHSHGRRRIRRPPASRASAVADLASRAALRNRLRSALTRSVIPACARSGLLVAVDPIAEAGGEKPKKKNGGAARHRPGPECDAAAAPARARENRGRVALTTSKPASARSGCRRGRPLSSSRRRKTEKEIRRRGAPPPGPVSMPPRLPSRAREKREQVQLTRPSCAARAPPLHRAVPIPHRRRRPRSTKPSAPAPLPAAAGFVGHPLQGIKTAISPAGKSSLKIERVHTP